MVALTHKISVRLARYLERAGLVEGDAEGHYLSEEALGDEMSEHQGYSINYRISVGPQKGMKVFALQTIPISKWHHTRELSAVRFHVETRRIGAGAQSQFDALPLFVRTE